jgi:hypothetical protein
MGFHKDDIAVVVSGPATGEIVTVLGEGNVWDHTVRDKAGRVFRLDPEQMLPLSPHQADAMALLLEHVRIDGFRDGYRTGYTDGASTPLTYYPGGN